MDSGAFATLRRGHTGRSCIIPEPTDLRLVTANAGSLTFRIEVPGLATHGSTRYVGVVGDRLLHGIHLALADLERRRNADPEPLVADLGSPTRCRSAGSAPATGRAACLICWSPKDASACG